jgi:acyl-CoA synthetase (AMP-forming)/AMP-acid ligase II
LSTDHPTALHAFLRSVEARPEALALRIVGRTGDALELTYADLFRAVGRAAAALDERHARSGDRLILSLPTGVELVALYLGALFRGVVPLIEPGPRLQRGKASVPVSVDAMRRRVDARWCVVPKETLESDPSAPEWLGAAEDWMTAEASTSLDPPLRTAHTAHLQPTSGSTGAQKVAVVTHGNIAANISGIGRAIRVTFDDALMFWLPLFHDMGLIAVSCSLYWQCPMTITDPSHFVRNPIRFWLRSMSQYRATITAAPNSAYEACARLADVRTFDQLDLSVVRAAFWGAEPVFAETVRRFERAFAPYGYRREATLPVYGLAEATLAATVSDADAAPVLHRLNGEPTSELTAWSGRQMVSVGRPLADHEIRVVDHNRQPIATGCIGEIEISGRSVIER